MSKTSRKGCMWKRYKNVCVVWSVYDQHNTSVCRHVLGLEPLFSVLDRPVLGQASAWQRVSVVKDGCVVNVKDKIMLGVSYRTMASIVSDLGIYRLLGLNALPVTRQFITR